MHSRDPSRITRGWPFFPEPGGESPHGPEDDRGLADAVASIVGIAAERARSSGTLDALRAAVEAALQPVPSSAGGDGASCMTRDD